MTPARISANALEAAERENRFSLGCILRDGPRAHPPREGGERRALRGDGGVGVRGAREAAAKSMLLLAALPRPSGFLRKPLRFEAECHFGRRAPLPWRTGLYREALSRGRDKAYRGIESLCLAGSGGLRMSGTG